MSSDACHIQVQGLHVVPVCHYRMEFAEYVTAAFQEIQPDHIAVELPSTLSGQILESVKRFPCLSIISYQNANDDMIYFPIEPTDPFCEAIRLGLEHHIPVHCIDLDVDEYPHIFDPMPDSYSVFRIGLQRYWEEYRKAGGRGERPGSCGEDERREIYMAWHLQKIAIPGSRVLLVCGMAHVTGILEKLNHPQAQPVGRVVRKNIRIYNPHPDSIREVTGEMPFFISCYEMERGSHPVPPAEEEKVVSLAGRRKAQESIPGAASGAPAAGVILPLRNDEVKETAPWENDGEGKGSPEDAGQKKRDIVFPEKRYVITAPDENEKSRKQSYLKSLMKLLAKRLNLMPEKLFPQYGKLEEDDSFETYSGGKKIEIKRENVFRFRTSEDRQRELMMLYRDLRDTKKETPHSGGRLFWDRQLLTFRMLRRAMDYYRENTGEEIKTWQIRTLMKFSRNYALVTRMLIADFYQLIMAARGVADDNFAYEVWDLGSYYPWQDSSGLYETIHIRADEVWIHGKRFTLRRRFPRLRERLMHIPIHDRKKERAPGEWTREFNEMLLCSYPPEDIVIEGYGDFLKKKALNILSEERARVEPFTNSLLDGIDVRETIRNWHHERKIYVKEHLRVNGGAGSVVVIFDEDPDDCRFSWKMTWLGEHHQESDMAFYSTPLGAKIVGPGISRCEYGGFMLTHPPLRLYDVWTDPYYAHATKKSEVLLMSAIEYSVEKHVIYVAASPPRSYFAGFASRLGKKIVYIPIGQLSPTSLKKLRVFHVLSGRHLREIAKDYVW